MRIKARLCEDLFSTYEVHLPDRHDGKVHLVDCEELPLQSLPPWAGAGLVHERERVLHPAPHVALHRDQTPQLE